MHGCGNDYIYFNCFDQQITSRNHSAYTYQTGISESEVTVLFNMPIFVADAKMRMFNLDGSEGKMCGNAIRCVAKYLYDNGMVKKDEISIETLSGIKA